MTELKPAPCPQLSRHTEAAWAISGHSEYRRRSWCGFCGESTEWCNSRRELDEAWNRIAEAHRGT